MKAIKAETKSKVAKMESREIRQCNSFSERKRPPMDDVVKKLGQKDLKKQARNLLDVDCWQILAD